MPKVQPFRAVNMRASGNGLAVPISKPLAELLGWNKYDLLQPAIVDGCLVFQRVSLPKAPLLRKKNEQEQTAR
jgi:hypothetical protein